MNSISAWRRDAAGSSSTTSFSRSRPTDATPVGLILNLNPMSGPDLTIRMAMGGAPAGITPSTIVFSWRLGGGCEDSGGGDAGCGVGGGCACGGVLCIGCIGGACGATGGMGAGGIGASAWGAGGTVAAACDSGVDGASPGRHQVGSSLAVTETCQSAEPGGCVGAADGGVGAGGGAAGVGGAVFDSVAGGCACAGLVSSASGCHQPGSDAAVCESAHVGGLFAGLSVSGALSFFSSSLIPDLPIGQPRRLEPAEWRTSARAGAASAPPRPS